METTKLNFECTHETADGTMTCSWAGGRVQLVEHFSLKRTYGLIDGEVKCQHDDLTVDEFMNQQCECQRIADEMETTKK